MSSLLDKKIYIKENKKNKYGFLVLLIFFIWLFWPNNNGFIKLSYYADNFVYSILKITHITKVPEYIHYRNNAVYLAKMYPKKPAPALKAMDRAIAAVPADLADTQLSNLYRESAVLKLYYNDKSGALTDFLSAKVLKDTDYLSMAVLLADESRYDEADSKCNELLAKNNNVISGHICQAYVYEKSGDIESAKQIYDSLVESRPNSEIVYIERASFKKRIDDQKGAEEDFNTAQKHSLYSNGNHTSIMDRCINIKELPLSFT